MENNEQLQKLIELITEQNKILNRQGIMLGRVAGGVTFFVVITVIGLILFVIDFVMKIMGI